MINVRAESLKIARESIEQDQGHLQAWRVARRIYHELDGLRGMKTKGGGGIDLSRSGTDRISIRDPGVCVVNLWVMVEGEGDSASLVINTEYWPEHSNERALKKFSGIESTLEYVAGLVGRWLDPDIYSHPLVKAIL